VKRHLPLLALSAVVLAGLIFLVLKLRGGPSTDLEAGAEARRSAPPPAERTAVRDHRGGKDPRPPAPVSTDRPAGEAPRRDPSDEPPTVVDHRGQVVEPVEKPMYKVEPTMVGKTRLALRPMIKQCATRHADELGDDRPRLQLLLHVEVDQGVLRILEHEFQVRSLPESGALVDCVRAGLDGFSLAADGHRDVERHRLTYPFDLPLP
jgi:hypothetical protein